MINKKVKITVVGAGLVGSTVLYTLMLKGLADELVLVNRNKLKAVVKAADIYHCTGINGNIRVTHGEFEDSADSDIVIVTSGFLSNESGSRTDVLDSNIKIYKELIPKIIEYSPDCILLVLTNPVDVMAYAAMKISGLDPARVIGTGTLLDTMRFKRILSDEIGVSPADIDALVIGEHGDSQFPLWSRAKISGKSAEYMDEDARLKIETGTKMAGWYIRAAKEHSCYAISYSTCMIVEAILERTDSVLPVSVYINGQYGIKNTYLSLPVKLNRRGVGEISKTEIDGDELSRLKSSAEIIGAFIAKADEYIE